MQSRTCYKYYFKINTFYKINIQSKTNLQKINTNKTIKKKPLLKNDLQNLWPNS